MKFKALISFSHGVNMYDPQKHYELDNEELVQAWLDAGYVEVTEEEKPKAKKGKKEA